MKILVFLIGLCISLYDFAQPPKNIEKIIFTNAMGEEPSKSIHLKTIITNKDDVKLVISACTETSGELSINDLTHTVVKGLIVEKITSWDCLDHFKNKSIEDIFSRSDIDKIDGLVMETIITRTALNDIQRNDIRSVFIFNDTIPFYLEAELPDGKTCSDYLRKQQQNLFVPTFDILALPDSLVPGRGNAEAEALISRAKRLTKLNDTLERDNITLQYQLDDNRYKRDSMVLESNADMTALNAVNAAIQLDSGRLEKNKGLIVLNERTIERSIKRVNTIYPSDRTIYRDSICKGTHLNVQQGRLYIDSLEITIKDGFLRIMKFSFSDSLDIIAGNAVKRIAALQMGFSKRQEFSLMVDLRSVSFSEFWLNIFFYLENSKSKDKYAFNLDNVIKYRPPQDPELVEAFVPRRSRLFFSKNNATILVPETDVNKIITLNLFTDIVGIEEEKPNGLIQAEAKFHGSLQRKASPGRFRTLKFDFFNYFEVNFTLSKIENKKKFLELLPYQTSTDSFSYIHTFNLLQYQNIEFGTKFNLFKISTDVHEGHLNFGVSTIRTGVRDSLAQLVNNEKVITPRDINLWSVKYRLQGLYRLKAISRVGVDISVDIMAITLLSDKVKQSGGTYDDIDLANNVFTETRFGKRLIATYQAQIYYYASRDESQRLYARLALNKDLGAKGNRFPVMQIGYSADINRFLQFK